MTRIEASPLLELARLLISRDTAGGNEEAAAAIVADVLRHAGFAVRLVPNSEHRVNLVATYNGGGAFTLSGHLDTVAHWRDGASPSLEPVVRDGRLYGRGSSDMKGGVAAMCVAATSFVGEFPHARGFTILMTADEETGCRGADRLARSGDVPVGGVLVIGEATGNEVRFGHKGATWYRATSAGIAAHGSRPDLGQNAIDGLARFLLAVPDHLPVWAHPQLGYPTTNIGTVCGGTQTNMVPAEASCTIDLRTVPGLALERFEADLCAELPNGSIERLLHLDPVWTDATSATSAAVLDVVASVTGRRSEPQGTAYFTDAAVFASAGASVYVLGPGDPEQPHSQDESCEIAKLEEATCVYGALLRAWDDHTFAA